MTAPLSPYLRKRLAGAVLRGSSARETARRFEVSPWAAIKLMQRVRETGSTAPAKVGGYRRPIFEEHAGYLSRADRDPQEDHARRDRSEARRARRHGDLVDATRLGLRVGEGGRARRRASQALDDVAALHRRCLFGFVDKTGAVTNMGRTYGWGQRGERLVDATPHGHWHTTTFVAGLRANGVVAPLVLDGPMTGVAFLAYTEQFLVRDLAPSDVVDNRRRQPPAGAALQPGPQPHRADALQA